MIRFRPAFALLHARFKRSRLQTAPRLAVEALLILALTLPLTLIAQGVDYTYYQSRVRNLPQGPTPFAYPVCDMLETYAGLPARLDDQQLLHAAIGKNIGLVSTFYQFMLEEKGLRRQDSISIADSLAAGYVTYRCPKGSVLTLQDPSRITSPGMIAALLRQGIKGIVISYSYMPHDWKKGAWYLDRSRGKAKGRHAVLVVGYQDSSLIFKNSWGDQWGEGGYGTMSFAYHRSHAQEGLVTYLAEANAPVTKQASGIALKTQPEVLDGQNYLQVSLVATGAGQLPPIVELYYDFTQGAAPAVNKKALILQTALSTGYPCLIPVASTKEPFDLSVRFSTRSGTTDMVKLSGLRWENAEYPILKQ